MILAYASLFLWQENGLHCACAFYTHNQCSIRGPAVCDKKDTDEAGASTTWPKRKTAWPSGRDTVTCAVLDTCAKIFDHSANLPGQTTLGGVVASDPAGRYLSLADKDVFRAVFHA